MKTKLFCTAITIALLCTVFDASACDQMKRQSFAGQNNFNDSLQIECCTSKKNNNVRLFPNPTSNGTLTINSITSEPIHFYIFDLEGTLVQQIMLKGKEQKVVTNLKKGTYTYDVFINDESIEQGKIIVK